MQRRHLMASPTFRSPAETVSFLTDGFFSPILPLLNQRSDYLLKDRKKVYYYTYCYYYYSM